MIVPVTLVTPVKVKLPNVWLAVVTAPVAETVEVASALKVPALKVVVFKFDPAPRLSVPAFDTA